MRWRLHRQMALLGLCGVIALGVRDDIGNGLIFNRFTNWVRRTVSSGPREVIVIAGFDTLPILRGRSPTSGLTGPIGDNPNSSSSIMI